MISLTSLRTKFDIVISDIERCNNLKSIEDYKLVLKQFSHYGFTFYSIIHDKDKSSNGDEIRPHIHLVLVTENRKRCKQVLNLVSDLFGCNVENVQVMEVLNLCSAIQYLTHKNDADKYHYKLTEVYSNDKNDNFMRLYDAVIQRDTITTDYLLELCCNPNVSTIEIIQSIGIANYNCYRSTIRDLRLFIGFGLDKEVKTFVNNYENKKAVKI